MGKRSSIQGGGDTTARAAAKGAAGAAPRAGRAAPLRRNSVSAFLLKCVGYWAVALLVVSRFSWIENACINATLLSLQAFYALFHQPVERGTTSIIVGGKSVNIVA